MDAKACWIATLNPKVETSMKNPFPHARPVSPFVPGVGDRIALVDHIAAHGAIVVAPGRMGEVVSRTCGVYEVRFDHEDDRTRHVFQDQITVLRRRAHGGKAAGQASVEG